ncbi:MAG: hypothetical protein IKN36_00855, partial [Clostridia bacterium]|nr:hypothetical protein [Clostridia bacterium]
LCFEEYIAFLKNFTPDGNVLFVNGSGRLLSVPFEGTASAGSGCAVYRVAASDEAVTRIPVPAGVDAPAVSGDNDGGFIVTVTFGAAPGRVTGVSDDVAAMIDAIAPSN